MPLRRREKIAFPDIEIELRLLSSTFSETVIRLDLERIGCFSLGLEGFCHDQPTADEMGDGIAAPDNATAEP